MDWREAAFIVIGGVKLALVLHRRSKRQGLAAGPGAEVDHLLPGGCSGKQSGKLRALVLHLDHALDEGRLGMNGGRLRVGTEPDAQSQRRPGGLLRFKLFKCSLSPFKLCFKCVDP